MRRLLLPIFLLLVVVANASATPSFSQGQIEHIQHFLVVRGINVPDMPVTPVPSLDGADGQALPDGVRVTTAVFARSERVFPREQERRDLLDYHLHGLLMHELIHYVMSVPTFQNEPYLYVEHRDLDEGITQAVTLDYLGQYLRVEFPETMVYPDLMEMTYGFSYKDQVVVVRKASAKCTNRPWLSKVARNWRVRLLYLDFNQRERMMNCEIN